MRTHWLRLLLPLPLLIFAGWDAEAKAQNRTRYGGIGLGVGVGYGPGVGPFWGPSMGPGFGPGWNYGPWGPGWGWSPGGFMVDYGDFYGNGLSRYGPPVPTYRPIPGVFGGADSRFFDPPPLFTPFPFGGWGGFAEIPLDRSHPGFSAVSREANFDQIIRRIPQAPGILPEPKPIRSDILPPPEPALEVLRTPMAETLTIRVEMPDEQAKLYIDGVESTLLGKVREFNTPKLESTEAYTYELRAEWKVAGLTTTHTKRVTGKAGDRLQVQFEK